MFEPFVEEELFCLVVLSIVVYVIERLKSRIWAALCSIFNKR